MSNLHNELKYIGNETSGIAIALGAGETDEGVSRLGETLTPVIDIRQYPEYAFLRGERLCAQLRQQGGVAAEFSSVALVVPAASSFIAIVETVSIDQGVAGALVLLQIASDAQVLATLATTGKGSTRDRRWPTFNGRADILSGSDPALSIGISIEERRKAAAETIDFVHLPIVLTPGTAVVAVHGTLNTAINVNLKWRERQLISREFRP